MTDDPTKRSTKAAKAKATDDVVLVHSATEDGGYRVLRKRGQELMLAELRGVEEGKPLAPGGELVELTPRDEAPNLFNAKTLYAAPRLAGSSSGSRAPQDGQQEGATEATSAAPGPAGGGPAQVSTPAYRQGWADIFGSAARKRAGKHSLN